MALGKKQFIVLASTPPAKATLNIEQSTLGQKRVESHQNSSPYFDKARVVVETNSTRKLKG